MANFGFILDFLPVWGSKIGRTTLKKSSVFKIGSQKDPSKDFVFAAYVSYFVDLSFFWFFEYKMKWRATCQNYIIENPKNVWFTQKTLHEEINYLYFGNWPNWI